MTVPGLVNLSTVQAVLAAMVALLPTILSASALDTAGDFSAGPDTGSSSLVGWTKLAPDRFPGPRAGHAMDYDPVNRRIFMFGGFRPLAYDDESWSYDAAREDWERLKTSIAPSPRAGHSIVYSPAVGKFVLFGGFTSDGEVADTWTFDPEVREWSEVTPALSPSPRAYHAMALHALSGKLVIYGGAAKNAQLDDTWVYDAKANSWTRASPADSPRPRYYHSMVWEPLSSRVLLFGGWATGFDGESWNYNLDRDEWTRLVTSRAPSPRQLHSMIYDPGAKRVVLFGGWSGTYFNGETWQYDGVTGSWENVSSSAAPSARTGHAMAYDKWNDLTLLFGGVDELGRKFDTWTYRSDPVSPSPRVVSTDPSAGEMGVEPERSITIEFDREMSPEETAGAILVTPPLAASRVFVSGRLLFLVHVADLEWDRTYSVAVSEEARSVDRVRLEEPFRFIFTAVAEPLPTAAPPAQTQPSPATIPLALLAAVLLAMLVMLLMGRKAARRTTIAGVPARHPGPIAVAAPGQEIAGNAEAPTSGGLVSSGPLRSDTLPIASQSRAARLAASRVERR